MKTSNKLLLAALLILLVSVLAGVFALKDQIGKPSYRQGIQFSRQTELTPFEQVNIKGHLSITFVEGSRCQLTILADSTQHQAIKVGVKNSILSIALDRRFPKKIECQLSGPMFSKLHVAAGGKFLAPGALSAKNLSLSSSSGGGIELTGTFEEVSVGVSSGATLVMGGSGSGLNVSASSGGTAKLREFVAKTVAVEANSGAYATVNGAEVSVSVSSGAAVLYNGNATLKGVKTSSGGRIDAYEN